MALNMNRKGKPVPAHVKTKFSRMVNRMMRNITPGKWPGLVRKSVALAKDNTNDKPYVRHAERPVDPGKELQVI